MPEPRMDIRIGDRVIRKQPPVIGYWCSPPTSRKAVDPRCVYDNAGCGDGSQTCPTCAFPFCDRHYPVHCRRFEMPVDIWREVDKRRKNWYDRVKNKPSAKPKVAVDFPEEDPAETGPEVNPLG